MNLQHLFLALSLFFFLHSSTNTVEARPLNKADRASSIFKIRNRVLIKLLHRERRLEIRLSKLEKKDQHYNNASLRSSGFTLTAERASSTRARITERIERLRGRLERLRERLAKLRERISNIGSRTDRNTPEETTDDMDSPNLSPADELPLNAPEESSEPPLEISPPTEEPLSPTVEPNQNEGSPVRPIQQDAPTDTPAIIVPLPMETPMIPSDNPDDDSSAPVDESPLNDGNDDTDSTPPGGWDEVIDGYSGSQPLVIRNRQNVLIKNCNITDVVDSAAISIKDSKYIRVQNCVISGLTQTKESVGDAIEISDSQYITIVDNSISKIYPRKRHQSAGIAMRPGSKASNANITISNNHIFDLIGNGIVSGGKSAGSAQETTHDHPNLNLKIIGNFIHDTGKIEKTVNNSPQHGMYIKAQDAVVEDNVVFNCFDGQGISLRSTAIVRGNKIWDTKHVGVNFSQMKPAGKSMQSVIENNIVFQTSNKPPTKGTYDDWESPFTFGWKGTENHPLRYDTWIVKNNEFAVCFGSPRYTTVGIAAARGMTLTFDGNVIVHPDPNRFLGVRGDTAPFSEGGVINGNTTSTTAPSGSMLCNPDAILMSMN